MTVKLSVIIPAFNAANTIRGCLASILDESADDVEIIVVDDGSSDGTAALCYGIIDCRIKVIQQQNQGVSSARNRGLEAACGKYIMFVDADDLLRPGWSKVVVPFLGGTDEIVYFSSSYARNNYELDQFVESVVGIHPSLGARSGSESIKWASSPFSKIFLRSFLRREKLGFDQDIINGEDALFNLEAFLRADKTRFVCETIYRYRIHGCSATHSFNERFNDSNEAFLLKLRALMKTYSPYSDAEISKIVDFNFCRSVEIMALRVAWIDDPYERRHAAHFALCNSFVAARLKSRTRISDNPTHERVVYRLVKYGHFWLAVKVVRFALLLKGRGASGERWVNI